ncbi:MAG: hypothetical protein OEU26_05885 [Candidatus Tectomicrobia bacterium]|nr:hypothetical protein [Candidatus Tectomicrobia bacterium]
MITTTQLVFTPTPRGALAGVLGSLIYLPVMLLLQPTPFAKVTFALWPGLSQTAGEFLGWLLHVALLVLMAIALAHLLRKVREPQPLLVAGVGWSFLTGWGVLFGATMMGLSLSLVGWVLESVAHLINGLVVGAVLAYMHRLLPAASEI